MICLDPNERTVEEYVLVPAICNNASCDHKHSICIQAACMYVYMYIYIYIIHTQLSQLPYNMLSRSSLGCHAMASHLPLTPLLPGACALDLDMLNISNLCQGDDKIQPIASALSDVDLYMEDDEVPGSHCCRTAGFKDIPT